MASNTAATKPAPARKKTPDVGSALGLEQDTLSRKDLQAEYGYTARQLKVDPALFDLFKRAFEGQWDRARFESEVEQIPWYRTNVAAVRQYQLLAAEGGADFAQKRSDTVEAVRQRSLKMGVNLSNQSIAQLAENSMKFGWGDRGREFELDQAIAAMEPEGGQYGGDIQSNVDNLKALALANNVKLDEQWYTGKARSIAGGLSVAGDAERAVREFGAQKAPGFAAEIMSGQNLSDLVSPWRRLMADTWEMAPDAIDLSDPMLQSAIGGFDEKGQPLKMNLGEFQIKLQKDPRFFETAAGQNKSTSAYSSVLKMFGMGN